MLKLIRKINNIFIVIILTVFYFIVIGLAKIIYSFQKESIISTTFWKKSMNKNIDLYSPY